MIAAAVISTSLAHAQSSSSGSAETKGYASTPEGQIDTLIKAVDRTQSGKISRDDATQYVLDHFDRLDSDHDGTLSLAELQAPLRDRLGHTSGTEQASIRNSLRMIAQDFRAMDKDRHGTVDKNEYVAFVQRQFDAANPDKDQSLDHKELASPKGRRVMVLLGALRASQQD
jgi:Ca2+-binding EF-hand superfamily protein